MKILDPAWKGRYGWSVSSDKLWRSCRRAFYYRYVAGSQPGADPTLRNQLYQMKALTPLAALEGRLVHECIESLIQQHRLGRVLKAPPAQEQYAALVSSYEDKSTERIAEAYNGLAIRHTYFDLVLSDGQKQIANFVKIIWPNLADLEYLAHEQFENFVVGGVKVNVKVDFVTKSPDGKVVVTDWKTGDERREENELQLAVYGMWAASKYDVPLDRVLLELAYLRTGTPKPVKFDEDAMASAKEAILAGSAEIIASDRLEDFATNPSADRCCACAFARVCPDGNRVIEDCIAYPPTVGSSGSTGGGRTKGTDSGGAGK